MEGSSGLIVAFVVALWAAYFVPLVLRRYDEAGKNSSLDQDGPTRRVVEPRRATVADEERPVVLKRPAPAAPAPVTKKTSPRVDRTSPAVDTQRPRVTREAARIAARRRRNVLLTLVAVLAVLSGLAIARVTVVWTPAIGVGLIVAWLVLCRVMVRQERGIGRQRTSGSSAGLGAAAGRLRAVPAAVGRVFSWASGRVTDGSSKSAVGGTAADEEMTVVVSDQVEDYDPNRRNVMEMDAPLGADALDEQLQIAVPSVSATTGEPVWDPLPITVPTYVSKPRAGRTVRTIEFGQPGAWTSGHVEGEQTELPGIPGDEGDTGTEQRAVGH
ncbi:divisome protein SepX/GlpR [Aeromicrobium duanguangcaii]|uniref:Uncharacterized protein n=1 Tax=Aeromicrobium duanguangcaii TaxID=2968086 RepID=A0ABY5KJ53_9ACTN|nr:hypothetical protein [Aeromicrobium duanguangcaii]MCD9153821.1 hypothetical protein [Aeromicrobium duanguangcaii]UUI69096.1 hypothetical protein NP095_03010 [Aeromicrobium duanguangcaii]